MNVFQRAVMFLSVGSLLLIGNTPQTAGALPLDRIRLPAGFTIGLYTEGVPGARSMALGSNGTLFVGTRRPGKVYAVIDSDRDYRVDEVRTIASGLNTPNGVAFRNGDLYVAEVDRILRYERIERRLSQPLEPVVVSDAFPGDPHHGWKYIAFGPDGLLYVPVGAPCNVCERDDTRYSTIMRLEPDSGNLEIFAKGIRNTVGFDWHPHTRELWFTNNGRDWMGDDLPPDTLHTAAQKGIHFGFPYCHAGDIPDPEYGKKYPCGMFSPPALKLDAHVAPLGMKFYTGSMFPERYRHQIFIAEHGSWNRSTPVGYRITSVQLQDGKPMRYAVFAEGWLQGGNAWGRPVDVILLPDGSLLVSDDRAGAIYRITYGE